MIDRHSTLQRLLLLQGWIKLNISKAKQFSKCHVGNYLIGYAMYNSEFQFPKGKTVASLV